MTDAGLEVDVDLRIAALIGERVAAEIATGRKERRPYYPPGVLFPSSREVVLTTGAPVLGNSAGPMQGWAWRVTRIQIAGATAGTYQVYRERGLGLQDLLQPTGGTTFAPNGTYEPSRLWVRYPYAFNAVGAGVTSAGLLVVDFLNVREDWLADAAS